MHGPDQQVRTNMRETRSAWKTRLPILIVMWFHYFHRICAYIKRARGVFPMRRVSEMTMPKIPGRGIYQSRTSSSPRTARSRLRFHIRHPGTKAMTRSRKRLLLVGLSLVCVAGAGQTFAADDPGARSALEAALRNQKNQPSYVEHLFGRAPVMPGSAVTLAGGIAERIQDRAKERLRQRVPRLPGMAPDANDDEDADTEDESAMALGPETELITIEHLGSMQRERYTGIPAEVVRANGQVAMRLDLSAQAAKLRASAVELTVETTINEIQRTRTTISALPMIFVTSGPVGVVLTILAKLDETQATLSAARSAKQILSVADQMAQASNIWQCTSDTDDIGPRARMLDVKRLDDEAVAGKPARVYQYTYRFRVPADGNRSRLEEVTTQTRVWVRVADGLPVRSELLMPGGHKQRSEFEYGRAVKFAVPDCAKPRG